MDIIPLSGDFNDDFEETVLEEVSLKTPIKEGDLNADNPQIAVFLRKLAWERHFNADEPITREILPNLINKARNELGLGSYKTPSNHLNFLQRLRAGGFITADEELVKLQKEYRKTQKSLGLTCPPTMYQ